MGFWKRLFGKKAASEIQVIELRGPEEIGDAESAAQGQNLPEGVAKLIALLLEAHKWGGEHGWPVHGEFPQYDQISAVGTKIHDARGKAAMKGACYYVQARYPDMGSFLDWF